MSNAPGRTKVRLVIQRTWNVRDGHGNSYGILDVSPDEADPAILLGIRMGATGERFGKALRPGGHIGDEGLDLAVAELSVSEPARVVLVGTVPTAPEVGPEVSPEAGPEAG